MRQNLPQSSALFAKLHNVNIIFSLNSVEYMVE